MSLPHHRCHRELIGAVRHRSSGELTGPISTFVEPRNTYHVAAMYLTWHSVALTVALLFGDALAIALSGQKFTTTPDKRQAQDLVRTQRLHSSP
jgi:hypothetical protein